MAEKELNQDREYYGAGTEKIFWMSSQYKVRGNLTKKEAYERLLKKIENDDSIRKGRSINIYKWIGSVAAVLLLVFSVYIISNSYSQEKYKTLRGEHAEYVLPDGTKISLNADSKVSYSPKRFLEKRYLKLSGEVFLDVEKGSEFIIATPNGKIKILGTELNIKSREKSFKVSCISGKVQVTSGSNEQIITKGESAELVNGRLNKTQDENFDKIISWRGGEIYFEDTSLISIFEELERQFDVSFVLKNTKLASFTGSVSNKNLKEALDIVCIPMRLKYEIQKSNKIIITDMQD